MGKVAVLLSTLIALTKISLATPSPKAARSAKFNYLTAKTPVATKRKVGRLLRSVAKVAGMPTPRVTLVSTAPNIAPSAHYNGQEIGLASSAPVIQLADSIQHDGAPLSEEHVRAINVHEWGHVLLFEALKAHSPTFARVNALQREEWQLGALASKMETQPPPKTARTARKQHVQQESVSRQFETIYADPMWHLSSAQGDIVSPYQELFADTIAVLFENNADAIYRATVGISPENTAELSLRRFGETHTYASTKATLARSQVQHPQSSASFAVYGMSAPIKTLVWRQYQKRSRAEKDPRPQIVQALARAVAQEVEDRLEAGKPSSSVEKFARGLRKRLLADPDFTGKR